MEILLNKPKVHRYFAYGTLKRNFYFHEKYLGGDKSNYKGKCIANPEFTLYTNGMPHLVREMTDMPVKGELYEIDEDVLKSLDELEGHPVAFKREIIEVVDQSGDTKLAWAYLAPKYFGGRTTSWRTNEWGNE